GDFVSGNPPFAKSFGDKVNSIAELVSNDEALSELKSTLASGISFEKDILMKTLNRECWFRIQASRSHNKSKNESILIHLRNIHEQKIVELNLQQESWTDPLTGLLNRRGLNQVLHKYLEIECPFYLLYIDLDGFKMVNDSLGHAIGDDVLIEICQRLKALCNNEETLCRFGGDEFILISTQYEFEKNQSAFCHALLEILSKPYQILEGRRLPLSASVGISHYPIDSADIEHIITCADAAMYEAKKQGKKRWVRYQQGMELGLKRVSQLAQNLALAIEKKELAVHYQPIKSTLTNEIVSFEALLRWNNKELGDVSVEEVIQIAEDTRLINEIENWVIRTALRDLNSLRKTIAPQAKMAVNISGLHLSELNFVENILGILHKENLHASDLHIELIESTLLTNIEHHNDPIQQLTNSNISVNIDDFGTGYSSLAYLHKIPASIVKVDKSFLQSMADNTVTLECIHRLVTALGLTCLIEGIETFEQAEKLKSIGYDLQQGYFHGRPESLDYYLNSE
ncbi:EAL domain-containing protein, partial [Marinomonas sp.]